MESIQLIMSNHINAYNQSNNHTNVETDGSIVVLETKINSTLY